MDQHVMRSSRSRIRQRLTVACLSLVLAACTVGPDFVPPEAPAVTHYGAVPPGQFLPIEAGEQALVAGGAPAVDWWIELGPPALGRLVDRALAGAPAVGAARARLEQAAQALRAGEGVFWPQADLLAGATRQNPTAYRLGTTPTPTGAFTLYTLSGSVGYALDLFGGQRRAVEGLSAGVDAAEAALAASRLALAGNLVNAAIAAAAYAEQSRELSAERDLFDRQVVITERLAATGLASQSVVLAARSARASAEAAIEPVRLRERQARHLMAILQGEAPAESPDPGLQFADFRQPERLPLVLPSALTRRRPDLRAAQAAVQGASAQIGVATAALFPSVSLGAAYGRTAPDFGWPGTVPGRFWSFGPSLDLPIFSGGTRLARREAAVAGLQAALADWRTAVLGAFAQVADVLAALEHDGRALQAQARAARDADESLRLTQVSAGAGLSSELDLITLGVQARQARIALLQARAVRLQDTVALMVALGGGAFPAGESSR
jgi:NodT family efflux transporter outer membrane factor (OMF) lipoprotein